MGPSDVEAKVAALWDLERTDVLGAAVGADDLRIAVLRQIADGDGLSAALARAALDSVH